MGNHQLLSVSEGADGHDDADLYGAVSENRLPSVAELNYEFMSPDPNAVVVAAPPISPRAVRRETFMVVSAPLSQRPPGVDWDVAWLAPR